MRHSQSKVDAFKQFMRENPPRELTPAQSRAKRDRFELIVAEWQGQSDIEADHCERARLQHLRHQYQLIYEEAMALDVPYEHLIRTMDQQEREFKLNRQKIRRILLSGNETAICQLFNRTQWFDPVEWQIAESARIEEEEQRTRDTFKAQVVAARAETAASETASPPEPTPSPQGASDSASEEELRTRATFKAQVVARRAERAASLTASAPTPAASPTSVINSEGEQRIRDDFRAQVDASRASSSTRDSTSSPRGATSPALTPEDSRNLEEIFEVLEAMGTAGSDTISGPNSQTPKTTESSGTSVDMREDEEKRRSFVEGDGTLASEAEGSHELSEIAYQRAFQGDVLAAIDEEKMILEMEAWRRVSIHKSSLRSRIDVEEEKKGRLRYQQWIKVFCTDGGKSFRKALTPRLVKGPGTLLRLAREAAEPRVAANIPFRTVFRYRFDACWGF